MTSGQNELYFVVKHSDYYDVNGPWKEKTPQQVCEFQSPSFNTVFSVRDTLTRQRSEQFIVVNWLWELIENGITPSPQSLNRDEWNRNQSRRDVHNSTEASRVASIQRFLKSLRHCHFEKRFGSASQAGRPDITGAIVGHRFEFEVKKDGQGPTPIQLANMQKWANAGCIVALPRTVDDVKEAFDRFDIDWRSLVKPKEDIDDSEEADQ